jgi:hypothetical protein
MKINNKKHISLTAEDVKDLLIKQLYHSQGISGIFDVKFKIVKQVIPSKSQYPQDSNYIHIFDGAEIIVDTNQ